MKNNFRFIYLLDHPYCIEVTPHANKGNAISILKNDQVIDTTPSLNNFNEAHQTCFDSFLPSHDIIELRSGGNNGVRISVKLINNGITSQLFFGKNADLTSVWIDGNRNRCSEQKELTSSIRIQNGNIIGSQCIGSLIYITSDLIYLSILTFFD